MRITLTNTQALALVELMEKHNWYYSAMPEGTEEITLSVSGVKRHRLEGLNKVQDAMIEGVQKEVLEAYKMGTYDLTDVHNFMITHATAWKIQPYLAQFAGDK